MSFFEPIKHLLPRARSWSLIIDKTLRQWFEGIAEWPSDVKDFIDLVWLDIFPSTTRELLAWEKQFGLTQGQSLIDGDMELPGAGSWTAGALTVLTKQTTDPYEGDRYLRITMVGSFAGNARQTILSPGDTYSLTGVARSDGTRVPLIIAYPKGLETGGLGIWTGTTSTSWQAINVSFTVGTSQVDFCLYNSLLAGYTEFDALVLTNESRRTRLALAWVPPTGQSPKRIQDELQANGFNVYVYDAFYWANELTDGNMEAVGVTAWFAVNATLTKQTTDPFQGTQLMRATTTGSNNYGFRESGATIVGHRYQVSGVTRSDGTSVPELATTSETFWTGTTSTSWQRFSFMLDSASNPHVIQFGAEGGTYIEYDDLKVEDLGLTLYHDPADMIGTSVSGNPLVNKVLRTDKNYTVEAGDTAYSGEGNEAGETHMQAGNFDGFTSEVDPYPIPTDSTKFPHFIYIGGSTIETSLLIDESRRGEFEDLCLKICPTEKWIGFLNLEVTIYFSAVYTGGTNPSIVISDLVSWANSNYTKGDDVIWSDIYTYANSQYPGNFNNDANDWDFSTTPPIPGQGLGADSITISAGQIAKFADVRVDLYGLG